VQSRSIFNRALPAVLLAGCVFAPLLLVSTGRAQEQTSGSADARYPLSFSDVIANNPSFKVEFIPGQRHLAYIVEPDGSLGVMRGIGVRMECGDFPNDPSLGSIWRFHITNEAPYPIAYKMFLADNPQVERSGYDGRADAKASPDYGTASSLPGETTGYQIKWNGGCDRRVRWFLWNPSGGRGLSNGNPVSVDSTPWPSQKFWALPDSRFAPETRVYWHDVWNSKQLPPLVKHVSLLPEAQVAAFMGNRLTSRQKKGSGNRVEGLTSLGFSEVWVDIVPFEDPSGRQFFTQLWTSGCNVVAKRVVDLRMAPLMSATHGTTLQNLTGAVKATRIYPQLYLLKFGVKRTKDVVSSPGAAGVFDLLALIGNGSDGFLLSWLDGDVSHGLASQVAKQLKADIKACSD